MDKQKNNSKKQILIIIIAITLALLLSIAEFAAHQCGLELRTFAQVLKGTYLWLFMPCLLLFAGNDVWKYNFVRIILFLAILLVSVFRGITYTLTDERVTEKRMPDGYIQGTKAAFLSESDFCYYEPVGIFFRKPFPGWTEEQLAAKVRDEYDSHAEPVGRQENGWHAFRVPDPLSEDEFLYFHISDSYHTEDNYFAQILLKEASRFWSVKERQAAISSDGGELEAAVDTGESIESLSAFDKLYITCCDSEEDIDACAADLTDWLQFVKNTGQLPYDTHSRAAGMLTAVCIGNGDNYFPLDITPLNDFIGEDAWEIRYERMRKLLARTFEEHGMWLKKQKAYRMGEEDTAITTDARDVLFMESYDGDFEKECTVADGAVRYRMVVRDAALGSRLYSLLKSTDNGRTWQMASGSPFGEDWGMGIDFTFLDEDFGFAALMHNGGDEADLYVTENGGKSYHLVTMEAYTVTLEDGYTYTPYDYPQMPYEEDGVLYVLCGQGEDGDYNGGDDAGLALYQSTDRGHTFTFVEIRTPAKED